MGSSKFGLNYSLSVQAYTTGEFITVTPPFTIEFDITRNTLSQCNNGQIKIYNLGLARRNDMRRNQIDFGPPHQNIVLSAGYGTNLSQIFTGNITQCFSAREGNNFITTIESFDGAFDTVNARTAKSFPAGTPQTAMFGSLISDFKYTAPGTIGNYTGSSLRGSAYSGNTASILKQLTGGGFFIDQGKANCLADNEYILDNIISVSSLTGLLGTPILERNIATFEMLFEPGLNVGCAVNMQSTTGVQFNGLAKIVQVKHRGIISASVASSVITSGGFFFTELLNGIPRL